MDESDCFTLWAGTVWLYKKLRVESLELREVESEKWKVESGKWKVYKWGYLIALIPALFMTMVCSSYILIAPEGLHLPVEWRWLGYLIACVITIACLGGFIFWTRKRNS